MYGLAVRLLALTASVVLAVGCVLAAGSTVKAAVVDPYIDVDFETYLAQQNFPESYKIELRKLHSQYPYWQFEAQHTNLEWKEAIMAEGKVGLNLVQGSQPSSWKSVQEGAYNWDTGEWVVFDSGGWVSASSEIISYYMDPRNFLDEKYVFQFLRHSYNAEYQTKEGLAAMVEGTFLADTYEEEGVQVSYVDTLMEAAEESGVSPYTLASMIIAEQGSQGTGNGIRGDVEGYEGYYNYFSVGAYKTEDMTAVQRGLWWAKGADNGGTSYGRPWNTRTKAIKGGAEHYGNAYVAKGQDTIYLKKFNVQGDNLYNHQYMGNVSGAALEGSSISGAYTGEARSANLLFKIPVYLNMPDSACEKPTGNDVPVKENDRQDSDVGQSPDDGASNTDPGQDAGAATPTTDSGQDNGEGAQDTDLGQDSGNDEIVVPEPKDPDGDITLDNVSGQVGDIVTLNMAVMTPSDVISDGKVILSYSGDALKLIENENVSGGAGGVVVRQSNPQRQNTVSAPISFEILEEGIHNVEVESCEIVTESEEILALTKGNGTVEGMPMSVPSPEVSQPESAVKPEVSQPTDPPQMSGALQEEVETVSGETSSSEKEQNTGVSQRAESAQGIAGSAQKESVEKAPEISIKEKNPDGNRSVEAKKLEKSSKKRKNVDASKYDEKEKEEATLVSGVNGSLKKQLKIMAACMAAAGIGVGAFYFLKDLIKNRK